MMNTIKHKLAGLKSELAYRVALSNHAPNLPILEEKYARIVKTLRTEGACLTSLEELELASSDDLLRASEQYLATMTAPQLNGAGYKLPQIYTVTQIPEFSRWANEQRLINIIENYIGLPVAFQGVHLRKDFPNENQFGTSLWHKDSEDRRIIKAFVYLHDVETEHGPFEYVPRNLTKLYNLNYYKTYYQLWRSGYLGIEDKTLDSIIPKNAWKSCPGQAGTIVLADTKAILHHGTARSLERSALFCVYTANPPKNPQDCTQYWDDTFAKPKQIELAETIR
ncbi:hypothetical protein NIES4071_92030 [Calothrix sp. NIES-4071]|nr:hypothetical protein NIES4071_92030 [Calothrix sp. NIES-4071]BAZ63470.1 hypothetical protein NIES4105_91960 [Calothrix sp. NIES-4105]